MAKLDAFVSSELVGGVEHARKGFSELPANWYTHEWAAAWLQQCSDAFKAEAERAKNDRVTLTDEGKSASGG